jgi:tetratricopeptide (TPR) repeat protein
VFAAMLCAQSTPPIRSWADAETLETQLVSHPDNVDTRVQLVRYYTQQGMRTPPDERAKPLRRKQLVWFIENHPEHSVLGESGSAMDASGYAGADAEGLAACSAAWQKALDAPKPLFDSFANAIAFYKTADPARARKIAEEGLRRYPGNAHIAAKMGLLMAYAVLGVKSVDINGRAASFDEAASKSREAARDRQALETSDDPNLIEGAARALQQQIGPRHSVGEAPPLQDIEALIVLLYRHANEIDPNFGRWKSSLTMAYQSFASAAATAKEKVGFLEKALAEAPNPASRLTVLPELARQYLEAGNLVKAGETANEVLNADQDKSGWNYGNTILTANLVLGRVAIGQGDTKEAARRLLAAGHAPTTPQLGSFGPTDWRLPEELLAAGDRDTVLAYLELLRAVWKNDNGRLNTWASTIRSGGTPSFTGPSGYPRGQYVGRPAAEFRLRDLHGAEVALSDFKGKVVLLDFWATWCAPCREEMPELQKIHRELGQKDVVVLALDVNEPLETVAKYIDKEKFTFPVLLANESGVMGRYGVQAYPTVVAVDKNGLVADVAVGSGSDSGSRLRGLIERARAGAPPPAPGLAPARPDTGAVSSVHGTAAPTPPAITAEDHYRDAVRQHNGKDYGGAMQSLDRALELRPDWLLAVVARADNCFHAKQYEESIAGWDRAIQLDPKRSASYNGRGLAYSNSGRHDRAIPDYTRAIELNADFASPYNNRGWAYMETGRWDEALADLNRAIELSPTYTLALFNRAHVFERRKEYAKAIADFDSILHVEPANTQAADQKAADLRQTADSPAGVGAASLAAPKLLSPPDGAVLGHYPRETTVVWAGVGGASGYMVEWDYQDNQGWASEHDRGLPAIRATDPVATFQFVGAQPGRWRVWAVDASGAAGTKSEWREFRYTQ